MNPDDPYVPIAELRAAMKRGTVTPTDLVTAALQRADRLAELNAVVVHDPRALELAAESDERFRIGTPRALEGIPFTVKDSYQVAGLTVASGSPAFGALLATRDAFTVETLKNAGAILIGKTNMPPMADGGMQRGLYGRSISPFNRDYLPAAYASGSSHGSAVAVATGIGLFGMGEETVSSGRSPAANNGICAYTPSRGVLSMRGNWPLFPTRDVVVPHTRDIGDMLTLLDVLVAEDQETAGDFWRSQKAVALPSIDRIRPMTYVDLARADALRGVRLAVPRRYLGRDPEYPLEVHPDVIALWNTTRTHLERAGAIIVETDFPLIERYEGHTDAKEQLASLGGLPEGWMAHEFTTLTAAAWDEFLRRNDDSEIHRLAQIDPRTIFPLPEGQLPDRYPEVADNLNRYDDTVRIAQRLPRARDRFGPGIEVTELPGFDAALRRLESLREELLEDWLDAEGFDAAVFPAAADIAKADSDRNPESADHAWQDGVFYSNGNLAIRHLGIPTVTTTMGIMPSIGMPMGVTFLGAAYSDDRLLSYAWAFEQRRGARPLPRGLGGTAWSSRDSTVGAPK